MALSQSALSNLLEAFRAGDGIDMICESVRTVLQELVEFEAAGAIGPERYERTEDRLAERNGTRPKLLTTKAGDVELRIPKLRKGSFFPSILEPRRRIDQALYAVVMEAYVHGISTRSVSDLVIALGADSGISKSEVSRICQQLDDAVGAFRTRQLDHTAFPYVYLDARPTSTSATSQAREARSSRCQSWSRDRLRPHATKRQHWLEDLSGDARPLFPSRVVSARRGSLTTLLINWGRRAGKPQPGLRLERTLRAIAWSETTE